MNLLLKQFSALLTLAVMAGVPHPLHAASVPLAPESTVLVVAKAGDKNEQDAARLLQTWLRKACASPAGFDIKDDSDASAWSGKTAVAVGRNSLLKPDSRLDELNDDGFVIHGQEGIITIAGHTSNATYYGVVSFLDRYAGVRFYMPGELWTSLPATQKVAFEGDDVVSQPFVVSGFISGVTTKAQGDENWLRKIAGTRRKADTHQHDLWAIFPPEKYAATHPEIYPIYNGQRYIPTSAGDQSWQVDFTEPATLGAAKESITEYFKSHPAAPYIAVSINDNTRWSESERNQQVIAAFKEQYPRGDYTLIATSDIYWRFMNQLAEWMHEAFPGKFLVGLAYLPTRAAPTFKLADNIMVFTVFHLGELAAYTASNNGQPSLLDAWLAATPHLANHDWYEGDGYLFPRIYSQQWSQYLRVLAAHESFAYMHAEAYPNWGFDGPKFYILAKMWWDPSLDPRGLTRQFCADMFGPAAEPMFLYFEEWEKLWTELDLKEGPLRKLALWNTQFKTTLASRSMLLHCQDLLTQAAALAQTSEQQARVALFAKCFAFSQSLFALQEDPGNKALHQHAVELANELIKDPWALYNTANAAEAIKIISKDPPK